MRTIPALIALATACSSGYVPRRPGTVAVVLEDGAPTYVRDGHRYPHGFLGGGLEEAVAGNPAAEQAAREYHDRQRNGLLGMLAAGLCVGVATGVAVSEAVSAGPSSGEHVPPAMWVAVGCSLAMIVAPIYILSAEPYRWDAINIYNDGTPAQLPLGPPSGPYSSRESLHMR